MTNLADQIEKMHDRHAQWRAAGHPSVLIDALARAYHFCLKRARYKAIQTCDTVIAASNKTADPLMRAAAHFYKGIIYQDWGQFSLSEIEQGKACDLFWLLGKPCRLEYALAKWALAVLKQTRGDYKSALYDCEEAVAVLEQILHEMTARQEPASILMNYQKIHADIAALRNSLVGSNNREMPLAYTFPLDSKSVPEPGMAQQVVYYRADHRTSVGGRFVKAVPTSQSGQWSEFDRQLDYHVPYFAIRVSSSTPSIPNTSQGDYLLACLATDNQLSRRSEDHDSWRLLLNKDGSYQLAPQVIGDGLEPYAYVDVIVQAGSR
jgi:hypothetical protein